MTSCPVCDSNSIETFFERNNVPVHQNLLFNNHESAINIQRSNLKIAFCKECGFVFNYAFDLSKLDYGDKYDNTQDYSPMFQDYLNNLAQTLIFDKNVKNCKIIEVGCGKGKFLQKLIENKKLGNIGYGFDPSYTGPKSDLDGRINFRKSFYDEKCAELNADIVICRHVVEHVPEPIKLLRTIKNSLSGSSQPRVFFETPDVEWILKNRVIWDFFYEHCSYFSKNSLITAFEQAGFEVEEVKNIFGTQYLLLQATSERKKIEVTKNPGNIFFLARDFSKYENKIRNNWLRKIQDLQTNGKVAIWGAGAKGTTFVNLIDPENKIIDSIIDLNPNKQGKYSSGTGHPIIGYKEIQSRGIKSAILMNPNYHREIIALLEDEKISIELIK